MPKRLEAPVVHSGAVEVSYCISAVYLSSLRSKIGPKGKPPTIEMTVFESLSVSVTAKRELDCEFFRLKALVARNCNRHTPNELS